MLSSYFKIAFRTLLKNRVYTATNVAGLTVGLAACGLIALYIFSEWRVDRFHEKGDRLYRVVTNTVEQGKSVVAAHTVGRPLAQTIRREIPEVEAVIPVHWANFPIKGQNNQYFFDQQLFVGADFLTAFTFPLREGDAKTALRDPYTVVLTERAARTYFGAGPTLGKTLMVNDTLSFRVTGVLAEPQPSHLDFQILFSMPTFYALGNTAEGEWFTWDEFCYILLSKKADPVLAEQKIAALPMAHNGQQYRENGIHVTQSLEPISSIYLHSEGLPDPGGANRVKPGANQLYLLGAIGVFLLLLACINFVNLTTAYQGERAKEVGIRKAIGAAYAGLVGQFVGESILLALFAGALAVLGMIATLPFLSALVGKTIPSSLLGQPLTIVVLIGFLLLTGLLAGWYPALLLARFRPIDTLKGQVATPQGTWLRRGLVMFQFCISLVLIISTFVVIRQLNFMKSQKLGFDQERVMTIELRKLPRLDFIDNYESIKRQVAALPNVSRVTGVSALPGRDGWSGQVVYPEGRPRTQILSMEVIPVDHDYVKTLGLKLRTGRDYSTRFATDAGHAVLLNEAACKVIGWKPQEAVGKLIETGGLEKGRVVGVIADFHQHGLQQKIKPLLTFISPAYTYRYLALRLGPGDVSASVAQVERFWRARFPGYEFDYYFLDDDFNHQYQTEQRLSTLAGVFAGLAILIACLGLFGLTTFTAERRTKEIGIRKVLGASVASIVALLSKDFLKLVLAAIMIASPLAWWAMEQWLQDFAYKIDIEWWVFALAGVIAILIAFATVSFQSIKAALANPVKSLKTE